MINTLLIYSLQKVKNIEGKDVNGAFSLIIVLKVITKNHYYFHCIFNCYILLLFIPIISNKFDNSIIYIRIIVVNSILHNTYTSGK